MQTRTDVLVESSSGTLSYHEMLTYTNIDVSTPPLPTQSDVPAAIDAGQAYYWRYTWQLGERESREEIARGRGKTFDQAKDALRWLLGDTE